MMSKSDFTKYMLNLLLDGTQLESKDIYSFNYNEIKNYYEYKLYSKKMINIYKKRRQFERLLALSGETFNIKGYNELIDKEVEYYVDYQFCFQDEDGTQIPNWRERLVCSQTRLNNRMRGCFQLIKVKNSWDQLLKSNVYITEKITPFFEFAKKLNKNVIGSEYLGIKAPFGNEVDGVRNEDLTQLTFPNCSFDILITNDVLEHIPNYKKAFDEIYRVLKKSAYAFFSVPFNTGSYEHTIRAEMDSSGNINYLLPPEYHGDPLNPEGRILCFQTFGWKMLDEFRKVGFSEVGAIFYWSLYHGFLGGDQILFYVKK